MAVIGYECKLPDVENKDEFLEFLRQKKNGVRAVPKERFNVEEFYSENEDEPGKIYCKNAGLVNG